MIPSDLTGPLLRFRVISGVVATLQSGMVHQMDADVERSYNVILEQRTMVTVGWRGVGGGERTGQTLPMSGRHGGSIL